MWSERGVRILKLSVAAMGALIVVGLVVLVGTIVGRIASGPDTQTRPLADATAPDIARLMGPDAEVVSTAVDGNRLALVVKGPDGLAVVVVDLRSGQVVNVVGPAR